MRQLKRGHKYLVLKYPGLKMPDLHSVRITGLFTVGKIRIVKFRTGGLMKSHYAERSDFEKWVAEEDRVGAL